MIGFTLRQLEYFVAAAEQGSVSAAAITTTVIHGTPKRDRREKLAGA